MNSIIYVHSGEVFSGGPETTLYSGAIGSCVVITIYDSVKEIGAMAHVMLPGTGPDGEEKGDTKYAANAIGALVTLMKQQGSKASQWETCIIGGANVLKKPNETIGKNNIDSVMQWLAVYGIRLSEKALGGQERRTVTLDIANGVIYYTVGDSRKKILWQHHN